MRRGLRAISSVLIVAGLLFLADAATTLLWQEPVSALIGAINQSQLSNDLTKLEHRAPSALQRRALQQLPGARARMAFLARALRRGLHAGDAIGRIRIPRIGASYVVVQGTDAASLRKGPGHYPATPLPGLRGTVAIAGHRTTYLAPFHDLDQLRPGDPIVLTMPYGVFTYRIERVRIVDPSATWVTHAVRWNRLVLTACHPLYSAAKRIVAFARLRSAQPRGAALGRGT